MAISSIGVGSGLPLDQLLSDFRKSENQPLVLIQQRQVISEARLSGYGIIKGALTDLQKASQALTKTEKYGALKGTSSNEAVGVKVEKNAVAGSYTLTGIKLATQQSLALAGQASRTDKIGTGGQLSIELNNGKGPVTIDLGDDTSLQGVMKAINANPDLGVQATLVNVGSDSPYRLMLTAKDTGTEASIKEITVTGNDELNAILAYDATGSTANYQETTKATNAKATVNGIEITNQSNTFKDVIEGVTLDLKTLPANGEAVKINITRDDSVAINAVKDFVKAYNSLLDTIKAQTSFDVENEKSSALTGDSLVRRVESQMRGALNSASSVGDIHTLADLGIKSDYKTGKLEINEEKLTEAVRDHLGDVTEFLSGANGVGKNVDKAANEYIKSNGFIQNATDGLNRTIKDLEKQYQATSDRIENKMENYRRQFSQLDVMMNQMSGISNYLTQQLSMLGNMNSSNNK
ncbi:flagellar hook-associated protein 2 [Paenalcaligenes hominis]|uniref:Flagellar hook-associated protein 2 n=1 Tax=Paenalcaligenes hominis TaxID=643674 RepID=A0ABX0WT46_9BURK|nr:flagellar filament capping protein FliD [Paenalcaligenes hominis]NJB65943.1 flagellar hook-associated protein 2 [Paenalcaligenes hominis]GGE70919.1 flagellar hook-associated protein 2 [Paenalcaligenes hominis]